MSRRLAVLDDYQDVALSVADWSPLAGRVEVEVFNRHLGDEAAVARALSGFECLCLMRERTPLPASLIARLPRLELVVTTGMRNLAIDSAAARSRGIDICGTAMLPHPAAEHAFALIMSLAKKIPLEDRTMHAGGWQVAFSEGLAGKTLGLLGLGKLGARVARMGQGFEMDVVAWSENLTEARAAECGVRRVERDALFAESDFVSVHLVLSDRSRGLVDAGALALMKPSAYLVNTSRGPIVDEAALVDALQTGSIAGAGIDVFDVEPLPASHALRALDNAVLTGHTGYVTRENFALAFTQVIENVVAWLDGEPLRVLNPA